MTRRRWIGLAVVLLGVSAAILWATSRPRTPDPTDADRVTLFSIDPFGNPGTGEKLHRYSVLGKLPVEGRQRRKLLAALDDGLARTGVGQKKCFDPRHVLRIERGDRVTDYVICFQCQNCEVVVNDVENDYLPISQHVEPVFDQLLADAGVPLAPK